MNSDISLYHQQLKIEDSQLCETLHTLIESNLIGAESKVWHGHPVWFLNGNPIVGYSKLKSGIQLLFWSGQSFEEMSLINTGKFMAAYLLFEGQDSVDADLIVRCLEKSVVIQWDYQNIVKKKGVLERL